MNYPNPSTSQKSAKLEAESDKSVVPFRPPEVTPEDRAAALQAEVERLACQQPGERMYWLPGSAERHGIEESKFKEMVEAQVRANDKKKREAVSEERKSEQRAERQRSSEQRKQERKQREQQQAAEKTKKEPEREAGRKQREREKEFAKLLQVPSAEQDRRLVALAKRLDEDVDFVRGEFARSVEVEEAGRASGLVASWPEPVETGALLAEVMAQVRRYVVIHGDAETTAVVLWIFFAWVHEIAIHSPMLVISASDGDEGKSTLCGVISHLTPRAYRAAEMTGPSLFRLVDHVHPTLIIDDADQLLPRKPDLIHIINVSWTKGTPIPRQGHFFDVFCPKVIAGVNVALPPTTATRKIPIRLWPRLTGETIDKFSHADDDTFVTLRRKLARWSADNLAALKAARPTMPADMINRREDNWTLQIAIADLAGGAWPKAAREAAIKLSSQRRAPSERKLLLAVIKNLFEARSDGLVTSAELQAQLASDPTSEWSNYHGRGRPITQREIAILLDAYDVHPQVIHPRGRKADRGYRIEQFEKAFRHYLQTPPRKRTTVRRPRKTADK